MGQHQTDSPKHIGIFGGTFDPVHLGHISLAFEIMEARRLDEVWLCPAFINPLKGYQKPSSSPEHRLKMLQMVIQEEPRFRINDIELRRKEPSYTIDTLREFTNDQKEKKYPDQFYFIMGEDAAKNFYRWRAPEEIISLATILIGGRASPTIEDNWQGSVKVQDALKFGFTPTRMMEISSSEIRNRLSKKLYCGHLLQGKVLDYIIINHLYS
jgi:nicotinate-nucleotide adenylyltransferase